MSRSVPLAAVALSLALIAPAHAKEITKVVVCGADGCTNVTSKARDTALMETDPSLQAAGGPTARGPGFVRVKATIGGGRGEHFTVIQLYVPKRDLIATRQDGGSWVWSTPLPAAATLLRRAVRGVRVIPARRLPAAALRTDPASAARVVEVVAPPKVETSGADGGMPVWAWPVAGLLLLLGAGAARRHMRA